MSNTTLSRRLAKLESQRLASGGIPIWCDDPSDMPATIAAMIEAGEIAEADICRCVHWTQAQAGPGILGHEGALALLDDAA
ncbi:hypothetical protein [Bosea sp. 124]|uniref:hypothetical protein n=1 Tax=Bosea sp. 124 TaxID=2135642 RepID=UPI000D382F09|nr:hypothetical protein [Bosea sp. 124]PTM40936.1 hypothetical protein C8D03_2469 [Bosea sp. 124]